MHLSHLEFMVLAHLAETVRASPSQRYGWQIAHRLAINVFEPVRIASVYRALYRLTKKGYVIATKGKPNESYAGATRVYYTITRNGEVVFRQEAQRILERSQRTAEAAQRALDSLDNDIAHGRTA